MRQLYCLVFSFLLFNVAKAQFIVPSQNDEYCPGTEYTFTVTIAKPYLNIVAEGGCYVTELPTSPVGSTFTFKGKFADLNQKQTFRIYYQDNSSTPFDFKKIKSLFYGTTCTPIQPNQSVINAPRCQIVNIPISFNNVQWSTAFESPSLCFGSITTYEYLLPNGWSIGANVSNGSNWIPGGNSVTVTSDLSNGVNGSVSIRPVNSCSAGLVNGQSQVIQIPISRPAPFLYITGGTDNLCNSSANYTVNGMPTGSTVSWAVQGSTASANITAGATSPTVTVTPTSTQGNITLVATVTHCTFTYTSFKNIRVGTYSAADYNITQYPSTVCLNQTVQFGFPWYYFSPASSTTYTWMWSSDLTYVSGQGTSVITLKAPSSPPISGTPWVIGRADNACGSGPMSQAKYLVYQTDCWSQFSVSPNPTSDIIKIQPSNNLPLASKSMLEIQKVELIDKTGSVRYNKSIGKGQFSANISVGHLPNDIYTLRIFDGKGWHSHKVIIKH